MKSSLPLMLAAIEEFSAVLISMSLCNQWWWLREVQIMEDGFCTELILTEAALCSGDKLFADVGGF